MVRKTKYHFVLSFIFLLMLFFFGYLSYSLFVCFPLLLLFYFLFSYSLFNLRKIEQKYPWLSSPFPSSLGEHTVDPYFATARRFVTDARQLQSRSSLRNILHLLAGHQSSRKNKVFVTPLFGPLCSGKRFSEACSTNSN